MSPHDEHNLGENRIGDLTDDERQAQLTAYALGELESDDEAAVAAWIAADDDARVWVDDARATAALLTDGFAAESPQALDDAARDEVAIAAVDSAARGEIDAAPVGAPAGRVRSLWPLVGVAATIAGVGFLGWYAESAGQTVDRRLRAEWARANPGQGFMDAERSAHGHASAKQSLESQRDGQRTQVGFDDAFFGSAGQKEQAQAAASAASSARIVAVGKLDALQSSNEALHAHNQNLERSLKTLAETQQDLQTRNPEVQTEIERVRASAGLTFEIDKYGATAGGGRLEAVPPGDNSVRLVREAGGGGAHAVPDGASSGPSGGSGGGAEDATGTVYAFGGGGGAGGGRAIGSRDTNGDGVEETVGQALWERAKPATPGGAKAGAPVVIDGSVVVLGDVPVRGALLRGKGGGAVDSFLLGEVAKRNTLDGLVIDEVLTSEITTNLAVVRRDRVVAELGNVQQKIRLFAQQGDQAQAGKWQEIADVVAGYLAESEGRKAEFERGQRLRDRLGLRYGVPGTEEYVHPGESTFKDPADHPLSTFAIDVDTASYANMRRFLGNGQMPPVASVRVEEMVNYFSYKDAAPSGEHPIAASIETASCPWNTDNRLVRIGIKAQEIEGPRPASNLVFLLDVSGSMRPADKLPLLQRAMKMLVDEMDEGDRIAIVTYASNAGTVLESTDASDKDAITKAIDGLVARGSTNGGAGIHDAYAMAEKHLVKGGVNRVILASDGDFNVGVTDRNELTKIITEKAKSGVFLSILGVGTGNLKDATLEALADRGNGHYHYLDGLREAKKVLVDDVMENMVTVAKDVKLQLEFNPMKVGAYRLIGYENRALAARDFNDDTKDAGEMGAGHTVTALYEVVPQGGSLTQGVDPLRYQKTPPRQATDDAHSDELLTLKVRYKQPDASESVAFELHGRDSETSFDSASEDLRWSSAVATYAMLVRGSPAAEGTSFDAVLELAASAIGEDEGGRRSEFLDLVLKAKKLTGR